MTHYDVIVIGSGAGGGTLVHRLAPSGKRVLLLERGDWLPREPQNWSAADVFSTTATCRPRPGTTSAACRSSRRSTTSSAAPRSSTAPRCTGCARRTSASCATTTASPGVADRLRRVRALLHAGRAALPGARGARRGSDRAARERALPVPGRQPRAAIQQLSDDLAAAGLQPFHAPCGVMLDEGGMPAQPLRALRTCDGFPCLVHAKSDAEVLAVRPALEYANVELRTRTRAMKLETNAAGRRSRACRRARRREETLTADIVVVSCGAANSAALLLSSANDAHPHGIANGSGQLGRNYMFHNSQAVLALSKDENPTIFQKTLGLNDFYFGADDFEYPLGNIQMVGKSSADMYRGEKPLPTKLAPQWTLDEVARHAIDFWLSTEDLPRPDEPGHAAPRRQPPARYPPTNQVPKERLLHRLKALLGHLGMHQHHLLPRHAYLKNEIPVAGVAHQAGTCRFGSDPATSVLNTDCRAHELDNLYVVDTSFFPSIGAVNPALTAMANALRVGDHLLERLGAATARQEPARVG